MDYKLSTWAAPLQVPRLDLKDLVVYGKQLGKSAGGALIESFEFHFPDELNMVIPARVKAIETNKKHVVHN